LKTKDGGGLLVAARPPARSKREAPLQRGRDGAGLCFQGKEGRKTQRGPRGTLPVDGEGMVAGKDNPAEREPGGVDRYAAGGGIDEPRCPSTDRAAVGSTSPREPADGRSRRLPSGAGESCGGRVRALSARPRLASYSVLVAIMSRIVARCSDPGGREPYGTSGAAIRKGDDVSNSYRAGPTAQAQQYPRTRDHGGHGQHGHEYAPDKPTPPLRTLVPLN
jgi:hypothetical protein